MEKLINAINKVEAFEPYLSEDDNLRIDNRLIFDACEKVDS